MKNQNAVPSNRQAKEAMVEALVRLTLKKPFSSISVTELCQTAGVSRMAFYRNYDSKEEVFACRLDELVEEYQCSTAPLLRMGELWYDVGHLTAFFTTMQKNRELVDSLFRCGFTWLLVKAIAGYLTNTWGNDTKESEYMLTGFAGFLCSCYEPWAEGGFQDNPRQMALLINRFYQIPSSRNN